jgi:hypothetical protein
MASHSTHPNLQNGCISGLPRRWDQGVQVQRSSLSIAVTRKLRGIGEEQEESNLGDVVRDIESAAGKHGKK